MVRQEGNKERGRNEDEDEDEDERGKHNYFTIPIPHLCYLT